MLTALLVSNAILSAVAFGVLFAIVIEELGNRRWPKGLVTGIVVTALVLALLTSNLVAAIEINR